MTVKFVGVLRYHLGIIVPDDQTKFALCDMIPGIHLPGREMKTEIFADFSNGLTNMNDLPDKLDEDMRACQKRMHYDTF